MAYIGGCQHHGQYLNRCEGCAMEAMAHAVVKEIKAGVDPDVALEYVREEYKKNKLEADRREAKEKADELATTMARDHWIKDNLPDSLKPKGPTFS